MRQEGRSSAGGGRVGHKIALRAAAVALMNPCHAGSRARTLCLPTSTGGHGDDLSRLSSVALSSPAW